jgi:hypothetical protein
MNPQSKLKTTSLLWMFRKPFPPYRLNRCIIECVKECVCLAQGEQFVSYKLSWRKHIG